MAKDKTKRLKDPLYGYIEIPVEYVTNIIDTAEFQRLRRIMQTSYSPLYSSAIHNRFVHSIGVFYLGKIVSKQLMKECLVKKILSEDKMKELVRVYQLACLLHDVGHAPFSHTGECFFKDDEFRSDKLHMRIAELVGSNSFKSDLKSRNTNPTAPHELMSVIIGIVNYGTIIGDEADKEFFARCITGYSYKKGLAKKDVQIKNCLISLLNSKVIDVDRLDYLIRDAYTTGYNTVSIDYCRLLNAVTICQYGNEYKVAYKKDALSIIENVVYAHDAERKWIQNHPVVLYEAYIIKHIITHLNEKMNGDGKYLFSEASLGRDGVTFSEGTAVSLLCDDDIIYLMKNKYLDELGKELFYRNSRRHPIWKSEAEYNGYVGTLSDSESRLGVEFNDIINALTKGKFNDIPSFDVINQKYIDKLNEELKNADAAIKGLKGREEKKKASLDNNRKGIAQSLAFCEVLKEYAEKWELEFDFVVLRTGMFNSNFSKDDLAKTLIEIRDGNKDIPYELGDVCPPLKASKEKGQIFYIFYRNKVDKKDVRPGEIGELCKNLFGCVHRK